MKMTKDKEVDETLLARSLGMRETCIMRGLDLHG